MKDGWVEERLGNVCKLLNGRAYKQKELLASGKYLVLRVGNFFSNKNRYYSDLELDENKYCDNGDLLYAWSASFGPRIWDGGKVIFHYHIWKTALDETHIDKKFLYYWFDWDAEKIKSEQGAGTTMIHVTKGAMENRLLLLPLLPEQERIVAILDDAFEGIGRAVANAEKNLANARELFESYLNGVLSQIGGTIGNLTLSDICDNRTITYGVIKLGDEVSNGVSCLRTSNVRRLYIETETIKRISPTLSNDYQRTILKGGEVLVNVRGTLGGVAVVEPYMAGWNVSREVAVVPSDQTRVNSVYLAYWIATKASQDWLTGVLKGVAYTGINLTDLRRLPITLPRMDEQRQIAGGLDDFWEQCRFLGSAYQKKLDDLAELKQSILQKAFSGELTAQPDEALKEAVA